MGREVRRVPLDFGWPLHEVWSGFLVPDRLDGMACEACDSSGYSPRARYLHAMWYGNTPFHPEDNGSIPLRPDTPAVHAFAARNVASATWCQGSGEQAVTLEAQRLADLWNGMWCHHLSTEDVTALLEANRLWDLTSRWTPETGWQPVDPPVVPTPEQVNEWSLRSFGHDSVNASCVIRARCAREGVPEECATCHGEGELEVYPGQREEREDWTSIGPPDGEGWQLWETVTEGSPISPVFPSGEELARWLSSPEGARANNQRGNPMPYETALAFVRKGWAPTLVTNSGGVHRGDEWVGSGAVLAEHQSEE